MGSEQIKVLRSLNNTEGLYAVSYLVTRLFDKVVSKVCSLLEWCFIILIDTCWDWFQHTYVLRIG